MKKNRFLYVAMLSLLLAVAVACSSQTAGTGQREKDGGPDSQEGVQLAQGVTDKEIKIGHFGPQTGFAASYDVIREGIQSYFNLVNAQGGVNGRMLKLIAYDNEYQPNKTVPVVQRLVQEDKVFAIVATTCTPCHQAAESLFGEIPMVGPSPASTSAFLEPLRKNWFGLQLNYKIEGRFFVDYAVNHLNAKRIAIFYENDDYGKEGYFGAKEELKKHPDVQLVAEVPHNVQEVDFSAHAQRLKQANPDVIIMTGIQKNAAAFRKEMAKIGATDIPLMVTYAIGMDHKVMYDLTGDAWDGVYSTLSMVSIDETDNPKIQEFVQQYSKDFPKSVPSANAQIGWAAAQVLVEGLRRAGDELTWDHFIAAMETLDDWDGSMYYDVYYTPDTRFGQTSMYLTRAKDGKLEKVTPLVKYDPKTDQFLYESSK
jgi:ABC-type branched-subunit amino acid transport system substrate-binding protein